MFKYVYTMGGGYMGDVVDFDVNKPHKVSEVICLKCYKRWLAVRPEFTRLVNLECPNCGPGYVIETGEEYDWGDLHG